MQFHKLLSTHYEAMPSVLLRLSVFSCLQLNRNDRLRRCRRNRMSLAHVLFVLLFVLLCAKKRSKLCVVYKNLFSLKIVFQIYYGIYLWKILFKCIYKNTFYLLIIYYRTYHIQCSIMHRYYKFYITGIYSFNTQ